MKRAYLIATLAFFHAGSVAAQTIDYERDVKPILAANCFSCHGKTQQQSGLRLDLRQNAMRGGDYGAVIVPGKSAESKLILRLTGSTAGLQMPPTGALPAEQIATLKAWIDQGAEMPGRADETAAERKAADPKTAKFLDAIHARDLSKVKALLSADKSLAQSADGGGSTALMHAAYAGTVEIMQLLLDAGADSKAKSDRKATALHWAISDPAKLKLLLSKGAEINAKTIEGRTPLYLAASQPAGAPVVQLLLEAGADPNARLITGATPLFPATNTSLESLQLLLDRGADPKAKSETGGTALMTAALGRNPRAVALLVSRGSEVNARTKRGETALSAAANAGDLESVKLLLAKGAEVNSVDYRGYTPLMHAAYADNASPELIRALLDKNAKVDVTGEGETPLSLAAKRGDTEVARLLRQAGAKGQPAEAEKTHLASIELTPVALRSAARRGLDLVEKTSPTFIKKGGCNSCHNQFLPAAAQAYARSKGVDVGGTIMQLSPDLNEITTERLIEYSSFGANSVGYELFTHGAAKRPLDARIAAQLYLMRSMQQPQGYWRTIGNRPPLTFDDYTTTAYAIYALSTYSPEPFRADHEARIARARSWLLEAKPQTTQQRAFHLLALAWSKAGSEARERASRGLQAMQRPDGGWTQLAAMSTDAYASGLALWALHENGMPPSHPVYQKGLRYLLGTQAADGTWHVKTRSLPFQPYFESGYPYGHDQWISAAGAAYATMAIAAAAEPQRSAQR